MSDFTQGTIISGIRSEKYPEIICNAIIISARCDLANCKVSKVYYIVAVALEDWLLSDEGFSTVIATRIKEIANKIEGQLSKAGLDWDTLNYDIAIISFDESLLEPAKADELSTLLGKKICVLKDRRTASLSREAKSQDCIVLADPYSINGLEFKCVILYGVDEGRVPQSNGVSDISANYIKYIAFNQLYLAASRAKYQLILLGNNLHGVSTCLQYALESNKLETSE